MLSYQYHMKMKVHNLVERKVKALEIAGDKLLMNTERGAGCPATERAIQGSIAIEKELKFTSAALLKIKFELIQMAYKGCEWK